MVTVSVVDCAIPHSAEVYLRADVEVNAAIADVADRECGAGFTQYTGQSVGGSPFVVTYLIDSNQDRTSANPLPSTVICLLQAAERRAADGICAPLDLHRDRLRHNASRRWRWRRRCTGRHNPVRS